MHSGIPHDQNCPSGCGQNRLENAPSGVSHRVRNAGLHNGHDLDLHMEKLREGHAEVLRSRLARWHEKEPDLACQSPDTNHEGASRSLLPEVQES